MNDPLWAAEKFTKAQAWVDLLLRANHRKRNIMLGMNEIEVDRGQLVTSQVKLSARWRWSRGTVNRFLNSLKKAHRIEHRTISNSTMITICNYNIYQDVRTPRDAALAASGGACDETSMGHLPDTNNKDEEFKEEKEGTLLSRVEEWVNHLNDQTGKKFKVTDQVCRLWLQAEMQGFSVDDAKAAIDKLAADEWQIEKGFPGLSAIKFCDTEFIQKWMNSGCGKILKIEGMY